MSYINRRKHTAARQIRLSRSAAFTALALSVPAAALAQEQEPTLPELNITASPDAGYKADAAASTKYTAPLLDTPKSVTVITRDVLQETNATTLKDALRTVPGITFSSGEGGNPEGDRPFLRGYDTQSSTYIDGLRDPGSQSRDMFNVEQIDVVKGPDSAYSGGGAIGGSVGLKSKQARPGNFADVGLGVGTADYKRATVDINRQLADHVAVRLNVMKEDSDIAGRDEVFIDHTGAALSLGIGLGTPTRAGLDIYHYETDDMPDYGVPYNNPYAVTSPDAGFNGNGGPLKVDRDNFYGLKDRDFRKTYVDAATVRIEHDINARWTLSNRTRFSDTLNKYVTTNPGDSRGLNLTDHDVLIGSDAVHPGQIWRSQKSRYSTNEALVNATELTGALETGSIRHSVAVGMEFSSAEVNSRGYNVVGFSAADLFHPDADDPWTGSVTRATAGTKIKTRTQGIYAFDALSLNPQWQLNLGLRWDRFDTKQTPYTTNGTAPNAANYLKSDATFLSYQAGVVFKPTENGSVYLNYATSANPSGISTGDGTDSISATNKDLDPEETRSIELGTKWNVLSDRLSLSAAVFDMKKTNAKVTVATNVMDTVGTQRIKGLELGVAGKLTDKWQVFGGYTYLDSELSDPGPLSADKGNRFPNTPKDSFSLWSTYELLPRLFVGGGANYMSKVYGNTANTKWVPAYWRFDAMVSLDVTKNVSLRLNIQNLTDKTYYDRAYATHMVSVAPGRQATLTANLKF
ncbi:iron transport outer membrane receptor [Betaproteobacteria bacterium]|nr:iron transport outer membrane receptor [Betaproteobacteria bacterium]GHU00353.1 iron transport outer membrane receptor [Betaproteobacteria bacterium]